MIDIEQRRLRTFEHDAAVLHPQPCKKQRHVANPRTKPFTVGHQLIEQGFPVEGRVFDDLVARVNVLARDYDGEAFILRGEERLPSALRGLGPTPRVAALWLSLRQWFTGSAPEDPGTALRLRGAWNDPIVTPAQ